MPSPTTPQSPSSPNSPNSNAQADLALKYRTIVANAYAAVAGQQSVQTFSAITFEELAAQQIDRLTGKGSNGRPNALQRIQRIASDLQSVANQIKQTDPSQFLIPDANKDVNTPP
jgi:hypothetical protein